MEEKKRKIKKKKEKKRDQQLVSKYAKLKVTSGEFCGELDNIRQEVLDQSNDSQSRTLGFQSNGPM